MLSGLVILRNTFHYLFSCRQIRTFPQDTDFQSGDIRADKVPGVLKSTQFKGKTNDLLREQTILSSTVCSYRKGFFLSSWVIFNVFTLWQFSPLTTKITLCVWSIQGHFYFQVTVNTQSFPAVPNLNKILPKKMGAREMISPSPLSSQGLVKKL